MSTATAHDARRSLLADIPLTEHRRDLAGVSTAVLEGGSGPSVVLLHGVGQSCTVWIRVIPELVGDYSLVVPDLPGHGASEIEDGRPPTADLAVEWLAALVRDTCPAPPILVGHNIGGAVAARFAAAHSGLIAGLVLADAFGLGPFRPEPRFALTVAAFQMRATERSRDRMLGRCMVDFGSVQRDMGEHWDRIADYVLDRAHAPGAKARGRRMFKELALSPIPAADLGRIDVPTTLIWGRQDPETRLRFAEQAAAQYGWPLHILEGCGADANIEDPDAFVAALRTALPAT
ncbi:alpha/beta fold hydrolase [Streptomyces apocyni]|uniref:alpha/beta fold hydrolase n=1 Tax=Streptomyces apocyni TaxID=2654677 RepID=UPI0012EA5C07|nr:alpha/beta hydrolase [Streptomyces apocyni]